MADSRVALLAWKHASANCLSQKKMSEDDHIYGLHQTERMCQVVKKQLDIRLISFFLWVVRVEQSGICAELSDNKSPLWYKHFHVEATHRHAQ